MRGKPVLVQFLDPVHEALTDEKKAVLILTTISIACVARVLACYTIKIASWLSLINHVMSCQSNW